MDKKIWEEKWWPLWLLFGIVSVLWGISWLLVVTTDSLGTWEQRGTFGDMFGAVNSLFSGLAFAGVIYAIFLQRRELRETRHELKRTADAQEKSERVARENFYLSAMTAVLNAEAAKMQRATAGTGPAHEALTKVVEYQETILAFSERKKADIEREE